MDIEKLKDGLDKAFEKMLEFKKYKKTPVVLMENGKIVHVDPHDIDLKTRRKEKTK